MDTREVAIKHFYTAAELLERDLGNPLDCGGPFTFARAVEIDEQEAFPAEACRILDNQGFPDYYVPVRYAGSLRRFDEVFTLLRVVSRRDLSVAIAHSKTFLGATPIWIAGSEEQRSNLARRIHNREAVALALTEEAHGGDLAASDCLARQIHSHYLLSGAKWLVNNATRSTVLCLLTRTRARSGPSGTSLFYIEKDKLDPGAFHHLPRVKTHGIRAIDISGIAFENAAVGQEALIGKEHHGLEYLFKTFQITRPLCSALSLGAADTALRLTTAFALERRVYGDSVFALPTARNGLVKAFADVLICECQALFAARALQVLPEQMSLWSSVTKYFVPTVLEGMVQNISTILGARYYLREHYASGMFQKIVRDIAIVGLFDGSTHVNLSLIAGQLGQLARYEAAEKLSSASEVLERLEKTCSLHLTPPEFAPEKLVLTNRGRDELLPGLLLAAEQLDIQLARRDVPAFIAADLAVLMPRFVLERERLDQMVRNLVQKQGDIRLSVEGSDLSKRHCILHAASACYYMWLFNKSLLDEGFVSGEWLVFCLNRLFTMLSPHEELISLAPYHERMAALLLERLHKNCLFGIFPVQLAPSS